MAGVGVAPGSGYVGESLGSQYAVRFTGNEGDSGGRKHHMVSDASAPKESLRGGVLWDPVVGGSLRGDDALHLARRGVESRGRCLHGRGGNRFLDSQCSHGVTCGLISRMRASS